jgi:hypothetical protein
VDAPASHMSSSRRLSPATCLYTFELFRKGCVRREGNFGADF